MGKTKNQTKLKKPRPKTGFENLVEAKENARKKKILKTRNILNKKNKEERKIFDLSDLNKRFVRRKLKKKNLFDLESDDEALAQI